MHDNITGAVAVGPYPFDASDAVLWWDITGNMAAGKALAELGLHRVLDASRGELEAVVTKRQASRVVAMQEVVRRVGSRPLDRGQSLSQPREIYSLMAHLGRLATEEFWVLLLDSRLRLIDRANIARGGANTVSVRPREVFSRAAREPRCSSVVLVHNHPSGDPTPSPEDIEMTYRLVAGGELLGIYVPDHIIIGDGRFVSLRELGHISSTRGTGGDAL